MITFHAWGTPAPKGSFRISRRKGGKGFTVRSDSDKTTRWEQVVGWAAKVAMGSAALIRDTPLRVTLTFYLPRPIRPKGARPMVKPDVDKLVRATLDPMTGIVFDEDSRIVELVASKFYVEKGSAPGCRITIEDV